MGIFFLENTENQEMFQKRIEEEASNCDSISNSDFTLAEVSLDSFDKERENTETQAMRKKMLLFFSLWTRPLLKQFKRKIS